MDYSSSQSSWKTFWFILLFPWNYEKRIISAQAPFKELQRNYFLKSFSLQSLFPQGNCGFVGREMKKVSCAQQQQILLSIINAATLLVLTIIHVLIMFAFCRGGENETQVSVSFSNCVNKDPKNRLHTLSLSGHCLWRTPFFFYIYFEIHIYIHTIHNFWNFPPGLHC